MEHHHSNINNKNTTFAPKGCCEALMRNGASNRLPQLPDHDTPIHLAGLCYVAVRSAVCFVGFNGGGGF